VNVSENTTLHDLLNRPKRLNLKGRRKLAVILANGLLHLKDSQWLENSWNERDICFMITHRDGVDLSRPYLASRFSNATEGEAGEDEDFLMLHQSPPLLALGIMLLELGLSKSIEELRTEDDLVDGRVTVNTNFLTAKRVLDEFRDELHDGYRAAVQACLDCDFAAPDATLDFEDQFTRTKVYQHIVEPLEAELFYGWKIKPGDLGSSDP